LEKEEQSQVIDASQSQSSAQKRSKEKSSY